MTQAKRHSIGGKPRYRFETRVELRVGERRVEDLSLFARFFRREAGELHEPPEVAVFCVGHFDLSGDFFEGSEGFEPLLFFRRQSTAR
jgi:hypothetical protein